MPTALELSQRLQANGANINPSDIRYAINFLKERGEWPGEDLYTTEVFPRGVRTTRDLTEEQEAAVLGKLEAMATSQPRIRRIFSYRPK